MKETRVEKFAEYRAEIDKMSSNEMNLNEKEEQERKDKNLSETSVQDLLDKYDEYTVLIDSTEVAEKALLAERRKKQLRIRKIKLGILYGLLVVIALSLIVGITLLIVNGL